MPDKQHGHTCTHTCMYMYMYYSHCFSAKQTLVLFPQSKCTGLDCVNVCLTVLHMALHETSTTLIIIGFFAVDHIYMYVQCAMLPFSTSSLNRLFLWCTVIKHDCVDLCRACDSLNRFTRSGVAPTRPKCFALHQYKYIHVFTHLALGHVSLE